MINLTIAINNITKTFTNIDLNIQDSDLVKIKVHFDDSIIEDKGTELDRDRMLVADNLMSPIEFRERWLGEDLETATENYRKYFKYELFNKYLPALQSGVMSPNDFVLEVYGVVDEAIVKYIDENLERGSDIFNDVSRLYDTE